MKSLAAVYGTLLKVGVAGMIQYRASGLIWMIGMTLEPIIYLVVWSTVAGSRGGEVGGIDAHGFAAYYLAVFVVNHATFTWVLETFQYRVQHGSLAFELLRPIHPIHNDIAENLAFKLVMLVVLVPAALLVGWAFEPRFEPTAGTSPLLLLAVPLAFFNRFFIEWCLALAAFWTTRTTAVNRAYYSVFIFLSGRVAPVALLPVLLQDAAELLPFYYMVGFPVDLALGRLSVQQGLAGLAVQLLWVLAGVSFLALAWRGAAKRFSAVGT